MRLYGWTNGESIHQVCRQDVAELALIDEGVSMDQWRVDSMNILARPSKDLAELVLVDKI
jgi:hypothetical protein